MKFFVCGGTGYVGARVVMQLASLGHKVCCVKRSCSNIFPLQHDNVEFCGNDIKSIEQKFQEKRFDWVLNMACSYTQGTLLYNAVLEANLIFPMNVLNCAVACGVKNFLTIGTGLPENFNMYSFAKKKFSNMGEFYCCKHDINFYSLALEMFYGPYEPRNRFLPSCIDKMCKNEMVQLTEGTQKRDIIYIDDVIAAIFHVIENCNCKGYQEISVGTGEAPCVREIIEWLHELLGSESELQFGVIPMRPGEPDCVADLSMLSDMGYKIKYSWKDGLRKLLQEEGLL